MSDQESYSQQLLNSSRTLECDIGPQSDQWHCISFDFSPHFPDRKTDNISMIFHPDLAHYEHLIDRAIDMTIALAQKQQREFSGEIFRMPGVIFVGWSYANSRAGSHFAQRVVSLDGVSHYCYGAMAFGREDISETVVFHEATHMAERLLLSGYDDVSETILPDEQACPMEIGDYSFASFARWQETYWLRDREEYWVNQCYRAARGLTNRTDLQVAMFTHTLIFNYGGLLSQYGVPRREVEKLCRQAIFGQAHSLDIRDIREDFNRRMKTLKCGLRV
jgi:hypothetical protein